MHILNSLPHVYTQTKNHRNAPEIINSVPEDLQVVDMRLKAVEGEA